MGARAARGGGRCFHGPRGHVTLAGFEGYWQWRTSRAKAHPQGMCHLAAFVFLQAFQGRWPLVRGAPSEEVEPDFLAFWGPLVPYVARAMGNDYARELSSPEP
eukprot:8531073-Pyramimonas_sp.AAC.1